MWVGRSKLTHGVQAGRVPSRGARQLLSTTELVFEIGLQLGLLVQEECAVVEALDCVGRGGSHGRHSGEDGCETHC